MKIMRTLLTERRADANLFFRRCVLEMSLNPMKSAESATRLDSNAICK